MWLGVLRSYIEARMHREDGEFAMEWAVASAVIIIAVVVALTAATPTIGTVISGAMAAIEAEIP
jgi:hypothetical protein